MKNVSLEVEGQLLVIKINLSQPQGASKSGNSTIIGSTCGNVEVPGHPLVKLGVNCYTQRP